MATLLKNNSECLINLQFGLKFASDTEIREMLLGMYYTEELVYDYLGLQSYKMQNLANRLKEYYNKLYDLRVSSEKYDPLANFDKTSVITEKIKGDTETAQFPMNTTAKKNVTSGASDSVREYNERTYGNIGVQTLGDIAKSTRNDLYDLYKLKEQYCKEFSNLFMITL